ncbi:MAG TPA: RNA 2',3'-cyclic phosphodiesterase [Actinobacteria bacterium]|nr:RNA 2',3'-cyclic phosphodiesterase [Actinomycetota bacterium]
MLRLFVALDLPDKLKDEIGLLKNELNECIKNAKWVSKDNLHFTLKFLGNCKDDILPEIKSSLKDSVELFNSFSFSLKGIGAFPTKKRARVLWVGVSEGKEAVIDLRQAIEKSLASIGFAEDKGDHSPHITFARIRNHRDVGKVLERVETKDFSDHLVAVNSVPLFSSRLTPNGPLYEKIFEIKLKSN